MSLLIGILTALLVLTCLVLGLLVLIQLPKKEAGIGQAFGGGATDALFGAGSGNALTQTTKYAAGIFLGLCLIVSWLMMHQAHKGKDEFNRALQEKAAAAPAKPAPSTLLPTAPAAKPATAPEAAPSLTVPAPEAAPAPAPEKK
ncbi:MAG TPA: preprotein translocase subunit SecG [Roseimicrobium sp.]|nr:preprotein translocase subunit SecG [Roseimicrobium sp.]